MSSILNSISSGLQVQKVPRVKPVKEDSIIEFLNNSEIEFETCSKLKNKVDSFNTGFGENNDLHFKTKCKLPELKTPLYQENYLNEFKTEEEKAAARHALGLYNKGDVVAMSLLTAKEEIPSKQDWNSALIKQMKQGDKFFTPLTQFKAVYDSEGITLDVRIKEIKELVTEQKKVISEIILPSKNQELTSLGDIKVFLQGFNKDVTLKNIIDDIDQEMLRFESIEQINLNNN